MWTVPALKTRSVVRRKPVKNLFPHRDWSAIVNQQWLQWCMKRLWLFGITFNSQPCNASFPRLQIRMWKNQLLALVTFFAAIVAVMSVSLLNSGGSEMSTKSIGFLGCGKISSAVARGYAGKNRKCTKCQRISFNVAHTWDTMPSFQVLIPKVDLEESSYHLGMRWKAESSSKSIPTLLK